MPPATYVADAVEWLLVTPNMSQGLVRGRDEIRLVGLKKNYSFESNQFKFDS